MYSRGNAEDPAKVAAALDRGETGILEQRLHGIRLVEPPGTMY